MSRNPTPCVSDSPVNTVCHFEKNGRKTKGGHFFCSQFRCFPLFCLKSRFSGCENPFSLFRFSGVYLFAPSQTGPPKLAYAHPPQLRSGSHRQWWGGAVGNFDHLGIIRSPELWCFGQGPFWVVLGYFWDSFLGILPQRVVFGQYGERFLDRAKFRFKRVAALPIAVQRYNLFRLLCG